MSMIIRILLRGGRLKKNPQERSAPAGLSNGVRTMGPVDYMASMIFSPKPEQLTSVAPSIKRSKS